MKRLLERQQIAATIKGDQIGGSDNDAISAGDAKTSRKTKAAVSKMKLMEAEFVEKKRKINEMEGYEDDLVKIKDEDPELFKRDVE